MCSFDCNSIKNNSEDLFYIINISYSGYKIEHQNKHIPLEKNSDKYLFYLQLFFLLIKLHFMELIGGILNIKKKEDCLVYLIIFLKTKKNIQV